MFSVGDRVIYVPNHAEGDITHKGCERGKVSSVGSSGTVFVRFDKQVEQFGWDDTTAQGCYPKSLVKESDAADH